MKCNKTIVTITGIRPDFIRMSEIFKKLDETFNHVMIHTGQHYDEMLSGVFFDELTIRKPDYNLGIGAPGKPHYEQQADLGPKIIECLQEHKIAPDIVLFLGDSNSSLASVPLKKEGYKIGHIEAGMRSGDEWMPEEVNRKICDHVSSMLFVYRWEYKQAALAEGISRTRIHVVGNTIVEVLRKYVDYSYKGTKNFILVDIHRHENVVSSDRLRKILRDIDVFSSYFGLPAKMLAFPRTVAFIKDMSLDTGSIEFVPLMSYLSFLRAQQDAAFIVSDSGTAQEEPALLGTPVIVPRTSTERLQSIKAGNSIMYDLTHDGFVNVVKFLEEYDATKVDGSWLGDGTTSEKIIQILKERL